MVKDTIRIGIVGAGRNTQLRHIPGFQAMDGVEIVSVCNRSPESSQRVAEEFGIPNVYDDWTDLVAANDTNAICIGTWPYLHCPVTLAALDAGKHVITEARMAMNATEARTMLDASRVRPKLVTQIVPSPFTLKFDLTIQELIGAGHMGEILAIDIRGPGSTFLEKEGELHWRHDRDLSGYNIMTMGIWYEAMIRWVGHATSVVAMTSINVPSRLDSQGHRKAMSIPDHVEVLCRMAGGAQAHLTFSAITGLARSPEAWLFGTEGTLHLDATTANPCLRFGKLGDRELTEIEIPIEKQGCWRVEEEFVNAIRGLEQVTHTTFVDGLKYMEFTEAVTRSAYTGDAVSLPL